MFLPILYSGTKNASSWAFRAWLALKHAGVKFDEVVLDIRRPQRFENLGYIAEFSPSASVPLLILDGRAIFDSAAIMEFANDSCGGALLPKDRVTRAQARSVVAWQHGGLSQICSRISFESAFYPFKRALTVDEQLEGERLFGHLEQLLATSGGPFLFETISLADMALAPAAVRLTRHNLDLERFPLSRAWIGCLMADRYVSQWMQLADALPHIWFEDYLVSGPPAQWTRGLPSTERNRRNPLRRAAGQTMADLDERTSCAVDGQRSRRFEQDSANES